MATGQPPDTGVERETQGHEPREPLTLRRVPPEGAPEEAAETVVGRPVMPPGDGQGHIARVDNERGLGQPARGGRTAVNLAQGSGPRRRARPDLDGPSRAADVAPRGRPRVGAPRREAAEEVPEAVVRRGHARVDGPPDRGARGLARRRRDGPRWGRATVVFPTPM